MSDIFDALTTLFDSSVLSGDTYQAVLRGIRGSAEDDEDKARAAFLLWDIENGNSGAPDGVEIEENYGGTGYRITEGRAEYLICTDDEADALCKDQVEQSLFAFNASFLSGETGIDDTVFEALADKCEGANDAIMSIIKGTCGFDDFVKSATSTDGRGHFLASYDHEENESGDYFIYRTN